MKIPVSWLKDYVEVDVSDTELAQALTFSGLEVESIDEVAGDTVLTIEVTPNRPDCLSVIGVAREVSALYRRPLRLPELKSTGGEGDVASVTAVDVEDAAGCPRYVARVLNGARVGPAPDWMQRRLELCDVRPINNLVDITNYVLLECGQPLHAFDMALLAEQRIVVRRARAGESITTLDDIERRLDTQVLVIADAHDPVALAGVMGGAASQIHDDSRTVLLESAYFDAANIRRTSRALGVSTESSYRFERGVDILGVEWASCRAAALMAEYAGATPVTGAIDAWAPQPEQAAIVCRYQRVRDLIGVEIGDDEIAEIFTWLGLPVEPAESAACRVTIPTFRLDLEREADLIEEVARIYGLDRVPAPMPSAQIVEFANDSATRARTELGTHLVGLGLTEVMNYSFVPRRLLDQFNPHDAEERVVLDNPISLDHEVMRNALTPQMLDSLGRNRARQVSTAALFEIGRVFIKRADGRLDEEDRLCVGLMGPVGRGDLDRRRPYDDEEMTLWIKGVTESLLRSVRADEIGFAGAAHAYYEPERVVDVLLGGKVCGRFGIVRRDIGEHWRLAEPIAVLEMALEPLLAGVLRLPELAPIPVYPSVSRDMALIVDRDTRHENVSQVVRNVAPSELTQVDLFDIYTGEGVGENKKSLAYCLTYQSSETTLTDEAVNAMHDAVMNAVVDALGAEIRGTR